MELKTIKSFEYYSDRLFCKKIFNNYLKDLELQKQLNTFEVHILGVYSQYKRILKEEKEFREIEILRVRKKSIIQTRNILSQLDLDMYYYFLTWDKLKKIFEKIKSNINNLIIENSVTKYFIIDYKNIRKCMDNLFSEHHVSVRNNYEHPSLKYQEQGKLLQFGTIEINKTEITTHVGGDVYGNIKKTHIDQLELLRIDFIDLFIRHFTDRRTTKELLKIRKDCINHVRKLTKNKNEISNDIFHNLKMTDFLLMDEFIPLPQNIRNKIFED
jgi:hypothetical protein